MSIPAYTFAPGDVVESSKANANWQQMALMLQKAGDSMTGTLGIQHVIPTSANTYDLGSVASYIRAAYIKSLRLLDTDNAQYLALVSGENLSGNKTLTIVVGDTDRTLTFTGDASISGTNTGDQHAPKTIQTPSGNAVLDAVNDTLILAAGNAAASITGASKTVTFKGPMIQTYVAESIPNPLGTNDYGPYDTDGFIVVQFDYQGPAGADASSAEIRVGTANPPTDVRAAWYRSIASSITSDMVTVPVKSGERVRVIVTADGGDEPAIITKVHFYPLSTA